MLNAVSNIYKVWSAIALSAALVACSHSGNASDAAEAESLVAQAQAALERGEFQQAELLLDSVRSAYPHQVAAGRQALQLRPKVMERKTAQEIVELQALLNANAQYLDSLNDFFRYVERTQEQMEPYLEHKDVDNGWRETNTAIARVSPSGEFYMLSSLAGNSTGHTAISLSADGVTVTSGTVAADKEPLLTRESQRFSIGKADTLGSFATQMDSRPLTLAFLGGKKAPTAKLSSKQVHAIADTWRLSQALHLSNDGARRLQQLKAKLQVSRDQQARVAPE